MDQTGLLLNVGGAEAILFRKLDLVLTGTYGQQDQVAVLKRQGIDVLQLGPWSGLAEGRDQIRTLAARLGHGGRGEALIAGSMRLWTGPRARSRKGAAFWPTNGEVG